MTMNTAGRDRRRRHHLVRINWLRSVGLEKFGSVIFDPVLAEDDTPRSRHHWKRVARRYQRYLARGHYSAENWSRYGCALKECGELSSAAHAYAMALSLAADSFADAHLQAGQLHEARGDTQKAVQSYRSSLRLNPENLDAAEELRALGISDEELSSIIDAAKVDRHNIGLHPADRILAARFKGGPPIKRRKWGLVLAMATIAFCLVWSRPSMLVGRPLEIAEDAYRSVVAEAQRLSGWRNVEVKAAARKGNEEGAPVEAEDDHLQTGEAGRKVAVKPILSVKDRERADTAEGTVVPSEQERKTVQVALYSLGHEIPTATGYFGPRTRAILVETQRLSGWQNVEVEAATRKGVEDRALVESAARKPAEGEDKAMAEAARRQVAEDSHLKAEEPAGKAEAKPKSSVEDREQAERAETALVLSEQDRKAVQVALNSLGHPIPTATGYFGPRTRAMITAWQKKQGLSETGYLDASQLVALREQATLAKHTDEAKLDTRQQAERAEAGLSLSEQDRKRVQVALNSLGHPIPTATGYFGPRTRAMITAWQKAQGLPETGYLTEVQLTTLQRQAALALAKYDKAQMKPKEDGLGTK